MEFYDKSAEYAVKSLKSNINFGLTPAQVGERLNKFGFNKLTGEKKRGFFTRLLSALKEPMLLILTFGLIIAFGANLGKQDVTSVYAAQKNAIESELASVMDTYAAFDIMNN